jgi:hypothetical protein
MPNFLPQIANTITSTAVNASSSINQRLNQSLQNLVTGRSGATALNLGFNALVPLINSSPIEGVLNNALTTVITNSVQPYAPPEIPVTPISGQKPKPLYTNYAGRRAKGDKPYSAEEDIVFFLLRADQTVPESSETKEPLTLADIPLEPASPVEAQTGGSTFSGGGVPNPLTQLAVGLVTRTITNTANRLLGRTSLSGVVPLVGYLTGLQMNRIFDPRVGQDQVVNTNSQRSTVNGGNSPASVDNATGANPGNSNGNTANSEQYFFRLGQRSFNLSDPTTPTTIDPNSFTFAGGSNSSLSTSLSENFPWINSDRELANTIQNTDIKFNNPRYFSENALEVQTNNTEELIPKSWYFITSPKDVSWKKEGKASSIHTYGSNTPYITYGNTSLRSLTLGEVMLEGFSNRKTVESNILALETCMNMVMNKTIGYVAPYCWKLFAGGKNYGTFIITNVSVKEVMRDLKGFATRATVDIELQQVPEFQVNTGRDLASKAMVGELSRVTEQALVDPGREQQEPRSNPRTNRNAPGSPSSPGGNINNNNSTKPPEVPLNSGTTPNNPASNQVPVEGPLGGDVTGVGT